MNFQSFELSSEFVNRAKIPCLRAHLRNSSVARVAASHIASSGNDPEFTVYLRSATPSEVTEWEESTLRSLFEEGDLTKIIDFTLKELEPDALLFASPGRDVQKHGLISYFYILAVIVDDRKKEVFVTLDTDKEFKPHESAVVVRREAGKWILDDVSYIDAYLEEAAIENFLNELGDKVLPNDASTSEARGSTEDVSAMLYGKWVLDEKLTMRLRSILNPDAEARISWLERGMTYEFTSSRLNAYVDRGLNMMGAICWQIGKAIVHAAYKEMPRKCELTNCRLEGYQLFVNGKGVGDAVATNTYWFKPPVLIVPSPVAVYVRKCG